MTSQPAPLRVGAIDFMNCFPLTWGLEQTGGLPGCTVTADTPDRLSDLLVSGGLDVGPISLVEALRHADQLEILDQPAVVADGPAGSVLLVTKVPLADLDGSTIALGSTSRTSVELARMLLEDRLGVHPQYTVMPPAIDAMLERADAAVLIGDPALRLALAGPPSGVTLVDLAEQWLEWTDLPMVFAVWAIRRELLAQRCDDVTALVTRFAEALGAARQAPGQVALAASIRSGLDPVALERYFAGLDLALDARARAGLEAFAERFAAADRPPLATASAAPIRQ
jgi:chorismate dehydratase